MRRARRSTPSCVLSIGRLAMVMMIMMIAVLFVSMACGFCLGWFCYGKRARRAEVSQVDRITGNEHDEETAIR